MVTAGVSSYAKTALENQRKGGKDRWKKVESDVRDHLISHGLNKQETAAHAH